MTASKFHGATNQQSFFCASPLGHPIAVSIDAVRDKEHKVARTVRTSAHEHVAKQSSLWNQSCAGNLPGQDPEREYWRQESSCLELGLQTAGIVAGL